MLTHIKTRFVLPESAHAEWAKLFPSQSQESGFCETCWSRGWTDDTFRSRALRENTTITEAVRRYMVSVHPTLADVWPQKPTSAAQLAKARRKSKVATGGSPGTFDGYHTHAVDLSHRTSLRTGARIMQALLDDVDSLKARNAARRFIEEWK